MNTFSHTNPLTKIRQALGVLKRKAANLWQRVSTRERYLILITFFLLLSLGITLTAIKTIALLTTRANSSILSEASGSSPIRGVPGDLWADIEIGKRDFGEIAAREIVDYKVNIPGGVIVDTSVSPGRLYVWDSGNNRIMGVNLATCYGQNSPCHAQIVIGQPSKNDYGACNLDSGFSNYPVRARASATTLCGVWEGTTTTLEDKSFVSMYADRNGDLFVPDFNNNRVLRYRSPFTTDVTADEVWGQTNFTGNACNLTGDPINGIYPNPTANSLCMISRSSMGGGGVTKDTRGNLWVADGGNNRILRYSTNSRGGTEGISKTADLVLGQNSFTSRQGGAGMNNLNSPMALRFSPTGDLYVADNGNRRLLKFSPPFSNGMPASAVIVSGLNYISGVDIDPQGRGVWVHDIDGGGKEKLYSFTGTLISQITQTYDGGGSIGFDTQNNLLTSSYNYGQDVYKYVQDGSGYRLDKSLFSPPEGYNLTSGRRLEEPAWVGMEVAGNQLVVADGRLLYWNNVSGLTNGKPADGYVGTGSINEVPDPFHAFRQVKVDANNRIWVVKIGELIVYQGPLSTGQQPLRTITSPLPALGGGQFEFYDTQGIAVTARSEFLWVSDTTKNRVFRIRNPLTNPVVDIVLGQTNLTGIQCNQGLITAPNQNPWRPPEQDARLDMLCYPGALTLDKRGNLFVSDHFIEVEGNWRMLMFKSNLFPTNNTQTIFASSASKEFPRYHTNNPTAHMTFEPAFNSKNQMVVGNNPYSGRRFVDYYLDPTRINPSNPRDPTYAAPNGKLTDYYGWAVAITFDSNDNLYVYDANRGKVMIYKTPNFGPGLRTSPPTPTGTPTVPPKINDLTLTPTPSLPSSSKTAPPNPAPTPTKTPSVVDVI